MKYIAHVEEKEYIIEIDQDDEIRVNGEKYDIDVRRFGNSGVISILLENRSIESVVDEREENTYEVLIKGEVYTVEVQDERAYRLAQARKAVGGASGEMVVKAPMPGVIVAVPQAEKSMVKKGQTVIILESMKMENELKAPRDGMVKRVHVASGVSVEKNQTLVTVGDPES